MLKTHNPSPHSAVAGGLDDEMGDGRREMPSPVSECSSQRLSLLPTMSAEKANPPPLSVTPLLARALQRIRATPPRIIASPPTRALTFSCTFYPSSSLSSRTPSGRGRSYSSRRTCTNRKTPRSYISTSLSYRVL